MSLYRPPRALTPQEVCRVCKQAKYFLQLQLDNDIKTPIAVRQTVTQSLVECGFWFGINVGGAREIAVTNEIAQTLKVVNVAGIEVWSTEKTRADFMTALDQTIARLSS